MGFCPRVPRALPADVSLSPVWWWDTRWTDCITTCIHVLGVGVVFLCNAVCISLARPVPLLPLQPLPVLVPVPAACTAPSHLALALALLPHLAQLQLQLQLQIPSIAHEHAAALLPHPVSIYLSLPCLPRLNRPCATRCLDPRPRPHPHSHTLHPHPILILALRLCPRPPSCALLPSLCLETSFTTVLRLAFSTPHLAMPSICV